jgi:hypothetical protein
MTSSEPTLFVQQAGVQHALRQHRDGGVMAIHETLARCGLGDGGLRGQHDFIERLLRAAERPLAGKVRVMSEA